MAGGKETPRQKMIGMMYLVLTALLALNVSQTILDAFVAIEENIQISNENEYLRGDEKLSELKEQARDADDLAVRRKAAKLVETIKAIDKMTAERIKEIDQLKLEILDECGEDTKTIGGKESIISAVFPKDPLKPMRMKLEFVEGKDKYDEPMRILIGDDITAPTGKGIKLWNNYNNYRDELTGLIASSAISEGQHFFFKAPHIKGFKDLKDLHTQIDRAVKSSNVHPDDQEAIKKIYGALTKKERSEVNDVKNVHWIGKTFDHSPSVAAIASLSSLQKEILTARADAVALIRSRVGGGEFSFNKIMPVVYGEEVINQGEDAEIQVLMAAFDSDRQPIVQVNGGTLRETKEGKGYIHVKGSGSEMKLSGTITILNKAGIPKTMPWEKTIRVMKPSGTVSLPKLNVLYRNYNNEIAGTASGFEETILSGSSGLQLTRSGEVFIGRISSSSRTATITISGRNKGTGKTQVLGTHNFRVSNLPQPLAYLGTLGSGTATPAQLGAMRGIFIKYPPEILLDASFKPVSWDVTVSGGGPMQTGTGSTLTPAAISLIKQARKGNIITITVKYSGPVSGYASTSIKVQ